MGKRKKLLGVLFCGFLLFGTGISSFAADQAVEEKTKELEEKMQFILDNYVGEQKTAEELYEAALKGMYGSLDDYSGFFNQKEAEEYLGQLNGSFGGIGVRIKALENHTLQVEKIFEGSPAQKMGILFGDIITAVDGKELSAFEGEATDLIRGEIGTEVQLKILRNGKLLTLKLTRAEIQIPSVSFEIKEKGIGYLQMDQFSLGTGEEFKKAIASLKAQGMKGMVLDLRSNPGGYLDAALDVSRQLVPKGPILYIHYKQQQPEVYESYLKKAPFPLVVLINNGSASASEVVAGAIQDSKAGVLVGEQSFGKGIVQDMIPQEDGSMIKMTTAEYLTPNKRHIHKVGLTPDVSVPYPNILAVEKKYKNKDQGEEIKSLELSLKYLGYFTGTPDEKYDGTTVQAVAAFQKSQKIFAYGEADFTTQKKLNESIIKYLTENDLQLKKAMEVLKKKL